ncbi:hypothetical protein MKW92_009015, partial [Papaver armeniacum]
MQKTGRELDVVMQGWLEEHKMKKRKISSSSSSEGAVEQEDFMDVMISLLDDKDVHGKISDSVDADTIIKSTCL